MKEFEIEPKCNNLTVAAYLLETVQRIPRYKLLLAGKNVKNGFMCVWKHSIRKFVKRGRLNLNLKDFKGGGDIQGSVVLV